MEDWLKEFQIVVDSYHHPDPELGAMSLKGVLYISCKLPKKFNDSMPYFQITTHSDYVYGVFYIGGDTFKLVPAELSDL